jgi:hypothetical protein
MCINVSNKVKILSAVLQFLHADGRTDSRRNKRIFFQPLVANAPQNAFISKKTFLHPCSLDTNSRVAHELPNNMHLRPNACMNPTGKSSAGVTAPI